jgi:hypothetical protein
VLLRLLAPGLLFLRGAWLRSTNDAQRNKQRHLGIWDDDDDRPTTMTTTPMMTMDDKK